MTNKKVKKYWALDNDEFLECYDSPEKAIENYRKNAIYRDEGEEISVFECERYKAEKILSVDEIYDFLLDLLNGVGEELYSPSDTDDPHITVRIKRKIKELLKAMNEDEICNRFFIKKDGEVRKVKI